MRASRLCPHSLIMSCPVSFPSHSLLYRTSVFSRSRILYTCSRYVVALTCTCSGDRGGRVSELAGGSPTHAGKSPIRKKKGWARARKRFKLPVNTRVATGDFRDPGGTAHF